MEDKFSRSVFESLMTESHQLYFKTDSNSTIKEGVFAGQRYGD